MNLDWHAAAACAGADLSLFFPEDGRSPARAKRICAGCPVRPECASYALGAGERWGVWGGLAEQERAARRRSRRRGSGEPRPASGFRGVFASRSGRWVARAAVNGRRVYAGTFDSPEAAGRAVAEAEASASPDPQSREKAA